MYAFLLSVLVTNWHWRIPFAFYTALSLTHFFHGSVLFPHSVGVSVPAFKTLAVGSGLASVSVQLTEALPVGITAGAYLTAYLYRQTDLTSAVKTATTPTLIVILRKSDC